MAFLFSVFFSVWFLQLEIQIAISLDSSDTEACGESYFHRFHKNSHIYKSNQSPTYREADNEQNHHFSGEIRILSQMSRPRSSPQMQLSQRWKQSRKESFGDDRGASSRQKQGRYGFTRKCGRLVKEQRARFYIMRRCVVMLICWTDNNNNNSDYS